MAANYSATIQLIVAGQQKLTQLQNQVSALNKQIKELTRLDIGGIFEDPLTGGAVAKLRAARNEQAAALKQTGQQQDLINRKLEGQLLNQIRLNSAIDLYKRRLNEVSRTAAPNQAQFKGRLQELDQAFQFFREKGSVAGVQATATELGRIVEYSREVTRLEIGRVKSSQQIKDYTAQIEKLKTAGLNTAKAEAVLDKFAINAGTNKYKLAEKYKIILDSRLKSLSEELRLQRQIAAAEARQGAGFRNTAGGAISSAVIGGGFPLLFGQGAGAAVGGGLGGLAGGLLGGGFGFALSIAGTALGDVIDQAQTFNRSLATLNASTQQYGATAQVTAEDVKGLAKSLNITKEEALDVIKSFSGFKSADITNALALLYGTDASTLENLAAVKTQADLAEVILRAYKQIGIEKATQLINQLKTADSSSVELAFQKALLEVKIKQTEEGLRQVTLQDRIIAGLASIGPALAGRAAIVDPAIFGQQRVDDFRRENKPQDLLNNALKALQQLRAASRSVEALRPDKGAEKAARDAERLNEQRQQQLEAATRMAVEAEFELQTQVAITDQEKLQSEYDKARLDRMTKYETLYKKALSTAEVEYLITAQRSEILKKDIEYEQKKEEILKREVADMYRLLDVAQLLDELTQRRLGRAFGMEGGAFRTDINLDPNNQGIKQLDIYNAELQILTDRLTLAKNGAEAIGDAFSNSFQGIVNGTQTTQQALQQFFQQVGQAFNAMAAEIIAKMITMYVFKSVLGIFGGGGGSLFSGAGPVSGAQAFSSAGPSFNPVAFNGTAIMPFAEGGFVTGPTRAVVGEGGEPEYVIPASKMRSAMNRYASGARGSAVIPAGSDGGDGMATTSAPAGAIDVRYTVERINSVDYVTADQFQRGMQQAAAQGAAQGEQRTLRRLQSSTSTRKRLGM